MKKVIVIVDKSFSMEMMEKFKEIIQDPNRPCIVASELSIKQVFNLEFDDIEVIKEPVFPEDRIN